MPVSLGLSEEIMMMIEQNVGRSVKRDSGLNTRDILRFIDRNARA